MKLYIYHLPLNRHTAEIVLDQENMHKFLTKLIDSDRASANLLYRLDVQHSLLFVQSDIEPKQTNDMELLHVVDMDHIFSNIEDGDHVSFRVQMTLSYSYSGKLHYLPSEHVTEWLIKKMQSFGLKLSTYKDYSKSHLSYQHDTSRGGKHTITVHDLLLNGTIIDKDKFLQHWHEGFGRHRAYGAGLAVMVQ